MSSQIKNLLLIIIMASLLPLSSTMAGNNNFYWQQQQIRQQQMMQQQRQMQLQRQQQEQMRQRQMQQQRLMRERQQEMQRKMQRRQQQAMQQRQKMVERQRQMQRQREQKFKEKQKIQKRQKNQTQQLLPKQHKSLQQQRLLKEQRKTRLRQDRLKRLQKERLKKQKSDKKAKDARSKLTLALLLSRQEALSKPVSKAPANSKAQDQKQFRLKREQQLKKQRITKQLEKQRKTIQAHAQKIRNLQKHLFKTKPSNKKTASPKKTNTTQKFAENAFGVCRGQGCGKNSCSFHGDTNVLTKNGLKPIRLLIVGKDLVWSRSESTGDFDWKPISALYSNSYEKTIEITIGNAADKQQQTVLSNQIHPFFVVAQNTAAQTEADAEVSQAGNLGKWVQAQSLAVGDRLLTGKGDIAVVANIATKEHELLAYNISVDDYHTFFIAGAGAHRKPAVWVHNECDPEKGIENLSKFEVRLLKRSKQGPNDTRIVQEGIGNRAKLYVFKKDKNGKWLPPKSSERGLNKAVIAPKNGGASNIANGSRLNSELLAKEVANGHGFQKHVVEGKEFANIGISTRQQYQNFVENIVSNSATERRYAANGKVFYLDNSTKTVVIKSPNGEATAFRPDHGPNGIGWNNFLDQQVPSASQSIKNNPSYNPVNNGRTY